MKPAPFVYTRPECTAEAVESLDELAGDATIIAGGQSLLPMMNRRVRRPTQLIDINHLREHRKILFEGRDLVIGALVRHVGIEQDSRLRGPWLALSQAAPHVGHYPIRTRGTFGGSLSYADPAAEFPLVALTLGAVVVTKSQWGARVLSASDFLQGQHSVNLWPNEMLTETRFSALPDGAVSVFEEFSERASSRVLASACVAVQLDSQGRCQWVRVGLGAVQSAPVRSRQVEALLLGAPLNSASIAAAADVAAKSFDACDTHYASARFRRELVAAVIGRGLRKLLRATQQ